MLRAFLRIAVAYALVWQDRTSCLFQLCEVTFEAAAQLGCAPRPLHATQAGRPTQQLAKRVAFFGEHSSAHPRQILHGANNALKTRALYTRSSKLLDSKSNRAVPGIRPGTSRTLSENHTTRLNSRQTALVTSHSKCTSPLPASPLPSRQSSKVGKRRNLVCSKR